MADYQWGEAEIRLQSGSVLGNWRDYSIDSDFLTPTDGWTFTFGSPSEWERVKDELEPGKQIEILIDKAPQLKGFIDSVSFGGEDGTVIRVSGRDYLMPVVKSNVHPDTRLKGRTIAEIVEVTLQSIYQTIPVPTLFYGNAANRLALQGKQMSKVVIEVPDNFVETDREIVKVWTEYSKKQLDYYKANPNEGAFDFLARLLRPAGLWLWATADGNAVIGGPSYVQPASYHILRRKGDESVQVKSATYTLDKTNVPSMVIVRGKGNQGAEFEKRAVKGRADDPSPTIFSPMFVVHDEATTNEAAKNYAIQELYRLKQDERVYDVELKGHRDPRTQRLYQVDTIAHVEDELIGLSEDMYVARRTFKKSATGGTSTTLKLVPRWSIRFSEVDAPTE